MASVTAGADIKVITGRSIRGALTALDKCQLWFGERSASSVFAETPAVRSSVGLAHSITAEETTFARGAIGACLALNPDAIDAGVRTLERIDDALCGHLLIYRLWRRRRC